MISRVHNILPHTSFLDALAKWLLDRHENDVLALSRVHIFLPTKRSIKALKESFLRLSQGGAMLLPRMDAVTDIDTEEMSILYGEAGGLKQPISSLRRLFLLTRLVIAAQEELTKGKKLALAQAIKLARALTELIDEVQTEGLDFSALQNLVPEDLAEHWQVTTDFLKIVTAAWPDVLADEGKLDPAEYRNAVIREQIRIWHRDKPQNMIIAAGLTGTVPAVSELIAAISGLDNGVVFLSGIDQQMDEDTWLKLKEDHPQYAFSRLLKHMSVERKSIDSEICNTLPSALGRAAMLCEVMRPIDTLEDWHSPSPQLVKICEQAIKGMRRVEAVSANDEAKVIALAIREVLETPGKTIALITPDRELAGRVSSCLTRWQVQVDDSAGRPLATTPTGVFLRLLAECAAENLAPDKLLALLKHPFTACGIERGRLLTLTRKLEKELLRGQRPLPGFDGLRKAIGERAKLGKNTNGLSEFVDRLEGRLGNLVAALNRDGPCSLIDLISLHAKTAEALSATTDTDTTPNLWKNDDGRAMAEFIAECLGAARDFPLIQPSVYANMFEALIEGKVVRRTYGTHPRASILGPLEARLQHFDHVILAGLNEGTWPGASLSGPWMSRPMRKKFGLPQPEFHIGIAAHDFVTAACAENVMITRSTKSKDAKTVPSRWLSRMDALLKSMGLEKLPYKNASGLVFWAEEIDRPESFCPVSPPSPRPPLHARPRKLSVTEIETWMRDPYALYAKHILGLRKLDPIDQEPGVAEKGQFIHKALELFVKNHPSDLPRDPHEKLLELGRQSFGEMLEHPEVWTFWWPRFRKIAGKFVEWEEEQRTSAKNLGVEIKGSMKFNTPGGEFTLTAKADRIDFRVDNGLIIIDYKTGSLPRVKDVVGGTSPQLPLEGLIAVEGGFETIECPGILQVNKLIYLKLGGTDEPVEDRNIKEPDVSAAITCAADGLRRLITLFDNHSTPYLSQPCADWLPKHSDYEHLARVREWSAGGEDGE